MSTRTVLFYPILVFLASPHAARRKALKSLLLASTQIDFAFSTA
jgi:hypothetical protein